MIDVKTGLLLWSAEALTLAAILMVAWVHKRAVRSYLFWSLGLFAHGAGVALVSLRGHIPNFLSIEIANGVALCAYAFAVAGLCHRDGKPLRAAGLLPATLWVGCMFIPGVRENLGYRAMTFNFGSCIGALVVAHCLWSPGFARLATRRQLAVIFLLQAISSCIGAVVMAIFPADTLQQIASTDDGPIVVSSVEVEELTQLKPFVTDIRPESSSGVTNQPGMFATVYLKTESQAKEAESWTVMIDDLGEMIVEKATN